MENIELQNKKLVLVVDDEEINREQLEFLQDVGCEKIQGYYYGKPMSTSDFLIEARTGKVPRIEGIENAIWSQINSSNKMRDYVKYRIITKKGKTSYRIKWPCHPCPDNLCEVLMTKEELITAGADYEGGLALCMDNREQVEIFKRIANK